MPILEGKEIKTMQQMIDAFRKDPELGRRTLRAEAAWEGALLSRVIPDSKIQGSGGDCLYAEELLEVLAKCLTYDVLSHGDHEGVAIRSLRVGVEGDLDFAGSVGLDAPAGFTWLRIGIQVDTDASDAVVRKLAATAQRCSIVGQSLGAVPQTFTIGKRAEAIA